MIGMCATKCFTYGGNALEEFVGTTGVFGSVATKADIDDLGNAARTRRHHHYAVRQVNGFRDGVRHEHHGGVGFGTDAQQLALHVLAGHFIKRTKWFVHQQQRRMCGKRTGDGNALLHAARQLPWVHVGKLGKLHQLEHFLCSRCALCFVPTLKFKRQFDVLGNCAPVEQTSLLKRHAVVLIKPRLACCLAIYSDLARCWL